MTLSSVDIKKLHKNCETALFKVWIVGYIFCRKEGRKELLWLLKLLVVRSQLCAAMFGMVWMVRNPCLSDKGRQLKSELLGWTGHWTSSSSLTSPISPPHPTLSDLPFFRGFGFTGLFQLFYYWIGLEALGELKERSGWVDRAVWTGREIGDLRELEKLG